MPKHKLKLLRSDDSLRQNLKEQVEFLINAARQYDKNGNLYFMKESATHLRVLFHDKGFSHSLISQISTNENWQSILKMVAFDEISLDPDTNQSPQDLNPGHVVIGDRMITPDIDQQVYVPQPISPQLSFRLSLYGGKLQYLSLGATDTHVKP